MRIGYKSYWKLPWNLGEVQFGHLTWTINVWFRGSRYRLWPPSVPGSRRRRRRA